MKKPISKRIASAITTPVPLFAVIAFCAASAFIGHHMVKLDPQAKTDAPVTPKYVIAERGTLIMQSVLSHPNETGEQLQSRIAEPILSVLQKYADQGYIVLEAARDENNNYVVAALPEGSRNITKELADAIDQAEIDAKKKAEVGNAK